MDSLFVYRWVLRTFSLVGNIQCTNSVFVRWKCTEKISRLTTFEQSFYSNARMSCRGIAWHSRGVCRGVQPNLIHSSFFVHKLGTFIKNGKNPRMRSKVVLTGGGDSNTESGPKGEYSLVLSCLVRGCRVSMFLILSFYLPGARGG